MPLWKLPQRFDGIPREELAEIFPEFEPYPVDGAPNGQLWHVARNTDLKETLDAWHEAALTHVFDARTAMRWDWRTNE